MSATSFVNPLPPTGAFASVGFLRPAASYIVAEVFFRFAASRFQRPRGARKSLAIISPGGGRGGSRRRAW